MERDEKVARLNKPKWRVTNCFTDSSSFGLAAIRPMAPRPALILPGHVIKLKLRTGSVSLLGKGYNSPSQNTNRGRVESARISSSIMPISFANLKIVGLGWNEFGPSSH